jgi:hypothetical protein
MKTFNEIVYDKAIFEGMDVSFMTDSELNESIAVYHMLNESFDTDGLEGLEAKLKEGFLGTLAGFIVGPAVGRVIANALGVEKGILFDMLTSRLVSAALGNAIQKNL